MTVRIHIPRARMPGLGRARGLPLGPALGSLLAPLALIEYLLCAARLGTDLGLLQLSAPEGVWSHWQVWMALAVSSHLCARWMLDAGKGTHRTANLDREARLREDLDQHAGVDERVKEMVKEALDTYEHDAVKEDVSRDEVSHDGTPRADPKPVLHSASRSPIAAEAEALRRRLRRF